jgi:uncharacterized protein YecE (DUF72 family)
MRDVYYFQTYHQGENAHSSNALLLLKRLYLYKSKIFYSIIFSKWFERGNDELTPKFYTQEKGQNKEKGKQSILDFTISQGSFKLYVEAKERRKKFDEGQMIKHLENLKTEKEENKLMIALAPSFSNSDKQLFEELKQRYKEIKIRNLTYLDIYNQIKEELDENRDFEMVEILDEYRKYCNEEDLIDDTNNIVMARLAGDTIEFNAENDVYYDGINHNYEGFRYIALYKDKSLKYIGKIEKILSNDGEILLNYIDNKSSDRDKDRLEKAKQNLLETYNSTEPHAFYLVEKFEPIENFRKVGLGALYGKKKFYLDNYKLEPNCSAKEIANVWNNKEW